VTHVTIIEAEVAGLAVAWRPLITLHRPLVPSTVCSTGAFLDDARLRAAAADAAEQVDHLVD